MEKRALRLRALQYDKMTALRQENREAPLIEQDSSLWDFQSEEVMDESTATILDAHVAQLGVSCRFSYMIFKIWKIKDVVLRCVNFVLFPKRLQEWSFFAQALFVCISRESCCPSAYGTGFAWKHTPSC